MRPLWKTNCERTAERLYESRPCQRTSFLSWPNSLREKSAASEACIPSFPSIPTPTSHSKIMPTSFPPSPIPQILFPPVYSLRAFAISAFYVGEHLHTHTHGARMTSEKNLSMHSWSLSTVLSDFPSMTTVVFFTYLYMASSSEMIFAVSFISRMKKSWFFLPLSPVLMAMFVAVSTLSPVSIQIWMPADLRDSIVNSTFS